ncbi:MAG: PAS domain-containing protein, partial [Deltaproteobacteria bacterium]|nr:PAS domain-containing protein [Deltaproteobacteria bacterium]
MISTVRREMVHLCIVLIISVTWAMYSISISLVERIRESIERFSNLPLSEFLINFGFLYMVGLIWLTHRRWKEADKKKEELHNIIESINPDLLLVVDLDRNIVMCNSSVQRMFGYS